jgi:hypothetical protein
MSSLPLITLLLTFWAVLLKALAVAAQPARARCARCGRRYERTQLGEAVCRCGS